MRLVIDPHFPNEWMVGSRIGGFIHNGIFIGINYTKGDL